MLDDGDGDDDDDDECSMINKGIRNINSHPR